jgi:hypothetical protein
MNTSLQHNIGGYVAVATSVLPQSATGNVNGSGLDRLAHNNALSCVLHVVAGADSGSPSTLSVQAKLQHAPDNSTWTDYDPPGQSTVGETAALTAVNTEVSVAIDLSSADRYVRAVALVSFTGGTSPAIQVAADIVFGGEQLLASV